MKKFAVFDIDGTFFRSHLYWETTLSLARAGKLPGDTNKLVLDLYDKWKKRSHSRAFEDFDYQSISQINELLHEINPIDYDTTVRSTLIPILDETYLYPKKLKEKLQKEGYMILAISGSRKEEVSLFCNHHGFDDWIGQTWHRNRDGSQFTGEVHATYKDKHLLLEKLVKKHNLTFEDSVAIGDTNGDISILETVENPIAFNPNPGLLDHARDKGWKIVLERKSIAFTLEKGHDGSYVLAKTDI